jgi:hypothetical protein
MHISPPRSAHVSTAFLLATVAALTGGCAVAQAIENKVDCGAICNRYKDCFSNTYDVSTCKTRCESSAKNDSGYESKVNICAACIDEKSCTSAVFKCNAECGAVVP